MKLWIFKWSLVWKWPLNGEEVWMFLYPGTRRISSFFALGVFRRSPSEIERIRGVENWNCPKIKQINGAFRKLEAIWSWICIRCTCEFHLKNPTTVNLVLEESLNMLFYCCDLSPFSISIHCIAQNTLFVDGLGD